MVESNFLTVAEVARRLAVRVYTVRTWLLTGRLRGYKLPGGDWRVKPEDIEAMLRLPVSVSGVRT